MPARKARVARLLPRRRPQARSTAAKQQGSTGKKKTFKREKKASPRNVHILASFNNTLVSVTDLNGNLVARAIGCDGFSRSRKGTPFAAQQAQTKGRHRARQRHALLQCVNGPGSGRESAIQPFCRQY